MPHSLQPVNGGTMLFQNFGILLHH